MARSLSLAAYRALSRRGQQPPDGPRPPRPDGELIWAHATDAARMAALNDLARRLKQQRPAAQVLLTHDLDTPPGGIEASGEAADWIEAIASDHPAAARGFVAHWQPDLCLWIGGRLLVNFVDEASKAGLPMILADLGAGVADDAQHKWFPTLKRASFDAFDEILASTERAAQALRRLGISAAKITVTHRLRRCPLPPGCNEDDLTHVTQELASRPVWLAAGVRRAEIEPVLSAHRTAIRLAHRLLLIVTLADPADAEALRDALARTRLRLADWDNGEPMEDAVQVLMSDTDEDLGLWYRVAPICFLGGSLAKDMRGMSPLPAASLGSAILYGPHVSGHADAYAQLLAAGGARIVHDADSLGAALVELIAPDRAAEMALAGWEIATEGAELAERLIGLVQEKLDGPRQNARP